ncbi:hypothetical protein J6590_032107 [Homalodisca vitripennis]|nr:hypothetical protein J6590_032107 [Homalodisca vitripennis]
MRPKLPESADAATWLHTNPREVVTNLKVNEPFGIDYDKVATMQNSVNRFAKLCLCLLNEQSMFLVPSTFLSTVKCLLTSKERPSTRSGQVFIVPEGIAPLPLQDYNLWINPNQTGYVNLTFKLKFLIKKHL